MQIVTFSFYQFTNSISETLTSILNDVSSEILGAEIDQRNTSHSYKLNLSSLKIIRPNYPNNCFTLHLNKNNIKTIKFLFRRGVEVDVLVEDRLKSVGMAQRLNAFDITGPRIALGDSNKAQHMYYAVQMHQTVFVEKDKSKSCMEYPSSQYESYAACNDDFVHKFLRKIFPAGFIPVWATDNLAQVTTSMTLQYQLSKRQD